ncbi:MAG TPA: pyruvate dehydrogenase (acetyl-transferring), homodimeric type [Ignavibacteriales bacterium]|nr:pyruvate dehydrogenase (acetyl-transferring), homodimeric type [Ignavibacteriales bacterium]
MENKMSFDDLEKMKQEELTEWLESLESVIQTEGKERAKELILEQMCYAYGQGVELPFTANTPYVNTIHHSNQPKFPGNRELERRIKSIIRWNAMNMVVRANKYDDGIGGHISSYASAATLYEIGFNHFFKGPEHPDGRDFIFFQGHSAPGIYARAFLEGRLTEEQLKNFRHEVAHGKGKGLSSYPHPWLMPNFWEFPTVSMGLGPLMAIYQARFMRYLEDRGLKTPNNSKIWAFLGDGETDEPETLGAITLAAREKLDNLIFVINCNLQRLDGPVRGNGNIVQELEAAFRGAGWNVIKVVWGSDWDPILDKDKFHGFVLFKRLQELIDGESQKYSVEGGAYFRKNFWEKYPGLAELVKTYTDEQLGKLRRGGHDPEKVYAAFKAATEHKGQPTVILAKTIKGYGLGESGEGKNITHQQKKLNENELREFRTRFGIPISDDDLNDMPFYKPADDSPEMIYLHERRKTLGGYLPKREVKAEPLKPIDESLFEEFYAGTNGHQISTTMAFVRLLTKLLKDPQIGKLVVPIVPDEARTFGMEALFRQVGIYSHVGQKYEPVDKDTYLYYKEAKDGQILEEGITEAGSMSSFIAAGTAYANHGVNTIPFFIYYSMFGFQRIGDLAWAAADMRAKGFMIGGTAGRTTLAGEGLQHQDGHSHLLAYPIPTLKTYDPAFAYEIAVIVKEGIKRMYVNQEDLYYYITVMNENYEQPAMPVGVEEGIIKGMYKFKKSELNNPDLKVNLLGSGAILNEVIKAAQFLEEKYNIPADIWSVTSYKELHLDALQTERYNLLNPDKEQKIPYITEITQNEKGIYVAASDYVQILADSIAKYLPEKLFTLGTFGFGRSDNRQNLRDFFEVDYKYIVLATLLSLKRTNKISSDIILQAYNDLNIDRNKLNPFVD